MNRFFFQILILVLFAFPCPAAPLPVTSSISYAAENPTTIVLSWQAIPGKQYNVLTISALGQPWQVLNATPLAATNNLVKSEQPIGQTAAFYKVVKLDSDPPEIWRFAPASNAIAVGSQSPLKAFLRDETAIDPSSIVLTVGTNPPITLADTRLVLSSSVLTYTPGPTEFLGASAQMVTNQLIVADTLGYRATNSWSFQLELPTVLADNAVLISNPLGGKAAAVSDLTLVSINGDTYVFSYPGASSGLVNGQPLVSTDPNHPYKRKILSVTDNPVNHTVSLLTTQASLAECIKQGSLRMVGDFSQQPAGAGFQSARLTAASLGASISLGGTVIYDNDTIRVEVTSGQLTFEPDFTIAGTFEGNKLTALDSEISGTVGLDMTLQATAQKMGDFEGSRELSDPRRSFRLLGFVGFVPVWVEAVLEFNIGYEAHLAATGTASWGFQSSRTLTVGATLRNDQWSHFEQQSSTFTPFAPGWQVNGSARVLGYVQPKLTVYLESLAGPSVDLKPYLELDGNACLQPGQAGADLSLYAGLSSILAIDVRGWDKNWNTLPSWELFNLRDLLWHKNVSTPVGTALQTFGSMVWIPCGTFLMGSPPSEALRSPIESQHEVTLTYGFWMGQYEVTQAEYESVMGTNPSRRKGSSLPVENVSWVSAAEYCLKLTERETNAGRLPEGYAYRLPTEAEWEYACRAGTTTAFHYGTFLRSGMANFYGMGEYDSSVGHIRHPAGIFLGMIAPVGSYAPNAWGLYDMHGNVLEWCSDWFDLYPSGAVTDPLGPSESSYRVVRGGSWDKDGWYCRAAVRDFYNPDNRYDSGIGFRLVLAPGR